MKYAKPFGVGMSPLTGAARALRVVTAWPAHATFAAHADAAAGIAAQRTRRTAGTAASVDGGIT